MRVCCGACGTKYQVADELVAGRRVRLRCRNCGAAISAGERNDAPRAVPPPPPVPTWFVAAGGELAGPFFLREILRGIRYGELFANDHLWQAGTHEWVAVSDVPEVAAKIDVEALADRPQPLLVSAIGDRALSLPPPQPVARPERARRGLRWIWLATAGGVIVALAATIVLLQRRAGSGAEVERKKPPAPIAIHIGKAEFRIEPEEPVRRLPGFEVKLDKRRRRRDATLKPSTDGGTEAGVSIHRRLDQKNVLVQRLFRLNEKGIIACSRIAERRGATLEGRVAEFTVEVDAEGKASVKVEGEGLSSDLLRCYRAIVSAWQFPATGQAYQLLFRLPH